MIAVTLIAIECRISIMPSLIKPENIRCGKKFCIYFIVWIFFISFITRVYESMRRRI